MDESPATPGIFRKVQNRGRDEEVRALPVGKMWQSNNRWSCEEQTPAFAVAGSSQTTRWSFHGLQWRKPHTSTSPPSSHGTRDHCGSPAISRRGSSPLLPAFASPSRHRAIPFRRLTRQRNSRTTPTCQQSPWFTARLAASRLFQVPSQPNLSPQLADPCLCLDLNEQAQCLVDRGPLRPPAAAAHRGPHQAVVNLNFRPHGLTPMCIISFFVCTHI